MATTVGFLLHNPFPPLSLSSAVESLRAANAVTGRELFEWRYFTTTDDEPLSSSGFSIANHEPFGRPDTDVDVLMVFATDSVMQYNDARIFAELRRVARRGMPIGGVSGGPVILARAGLLSGRRYTAHWEHVPALLEEFPDLDLRRTLYEVDGPVFTCAGGHATLDMMNVFISVQYGAETAQRASDWLLQTHIRQGEAPQRMALRDRLDITHPALIKAIGKLEASLDRPLDRDAFAVEMGLSLRQLERLFETKMGTTIHKYLMKLRLERAHLLIKQSSLSLSEIAVATGFVNFGHFSKVYKSTFGLPPRESRKLPFYK